MALLFAISSLASCLLLLLLLLLLSLPSEAPPRVARTNDGLTTTDDDDLNAATPPSMQYTETTMVVNTVKTIFTIVNVSYRKEYDESALRVELNPPPHSTPHATDHDENNRRRCLSCSRRRYHGRRLRALHLFDIIVVITIHGKQEQAKDCITYSLGRSGDVCKS